MSSTNLSGALLAVLLLIHTTVQAQNYYSAGNTKTNNSLAYLKVAGNAIIIRFTFQKKEVTFRDIYDSLKRLKGVNVYASEAVLANPKTVNCDLKNESLAGCLGFLERAFGIQIMNIGGIIFFDEKPSGNKTTGIINDELPPKVTVMDPVLVYNDGFQQISLAQAIGAYEQPDLSGYVPHIAAHNMVEALEGFILQPYRGNPGESLLFFYSPRGISTLHGNDRATFTLNDFDFNQSLEYLNPHDMQSPTLCKDATAAAQWGSGSANSVVVTSAKTGSAGPLAIQLINGTTICRRDRLNDQHYLDAATLLDIRSQGVAATGPNSFTNINTETPGSLLLKQLKDGSIAKDTGEPLLRKLASNNFLKEIDNAFYRNRMDQQNYLSLSFGTGDLSIYGSMGFDKTWMAEKGNEWRRITSMFNASYARPKLLIRLMGYGAFIREKNNFIALTAGESDLSLYNPDGSYAQIPNKYAFDFTSSNEGAPFRYIPGQEAQLANNKTIKNFYLIHSKAGYAVAPHLQLSIAGQFSQSNITNAQRHAAASFFTRDLVYTYAMKDAAGVYSYPLPLRPITDKYETTITNYDLRPQADFRFRGKGFTISGLMAANMTGYLMKGAGGRSYELNGSDQPINFDTAYPTISGYTQRIPNPEPQKDSANYFLIALGSIKASLFDRYNFSFSIRNERSNRFTADINKHGITLWAAGASWNINKERFLKENRAIRELKLRTDYGINGNMDFSVPPMETIQPLPQGNGYTVNFPQTPHLQPEQIYTLNVGLDIAVLKWLSGRFDYYIKRSGNLLSYSNWNPTTGFSIVKSNSGAITARGLDVELRAANIKLTDSLAYNATLMFGYAANKVRSADAITRKSWEIVDPSVRAVVQGYSIYSIFAYRDAGLDPNTGEPRGYLREQPSKEYAKLLDTFDQSSIKYIGSSVPKAVFNFRQSITFRKHFTVSVLLTGAFGYYVRTRALSYYGLFNDLDGGTQDYFNRWKERGDESRTTVPALVFPLDINRDRVYSLNETHYVKGDHIRWENLQFSYSVNNTGRKRYSFDKIDFTLSFDHLGMLWKANKKGIDPDVAIGATSIPFGMTFSINAHF